MRHSQLTSFVSPNNRLFVQINAPSYSTIVSFYFSQLYKFKHYIHQLCIHILRTFHISFLIKRKVFYYEKLLYFLLHLLSRKERDRENDKKKMREEEAGTYRVFIIAKVRMKTEEAKIHIARSPIYFFFHKEKIHHQNTP